MKQEVYEMNVNVGLEVKTCPVCFVIYAVPKELMKRKSADNGNWFCPNGHNLVFTKSELQRVREELEKAKENENWWKKRKYEADEENRILERKISAKKGEITRIKNRISNGVCPCCRRSFVNLQKHMKNQHPGYSEKENEDKRN